MVTNSATLPTLAHGLLLKLDISVWTGTAALEAPDLGLDPAALAAHYTLGRKRLVPKEALEPIRHLAARARYALECLSTGLPDGGRFVLAHVVPEVLDRLEADRQTFQEAVRAFLAAYPDWQAKMRPEWEAAAREAWRTAGQPGDGAAFREAFLARVETAYPPAERLGRKFDFFWFTYQLQLSGLAKIDTAAAAATAEAERQRRDRDETYRAQVEARIAEALDRSMAEYRQQVAEAFGAVLEHVGSGKALRQGAVARLRRTIARFRKLNLFGDDALERELAQFEAECLDGLDPARVADSPDLSALFQRGLEQVVSTATAPTERSALTGRLRRSLELDAAPEPGAEPAGAVAE